MFLSGGEPTLYKDIVPLANWLLDRGHYVILYTNLWKPEALEGIRPQWRFLIVPTFHAEDNLERFKSAMDSLSRFNIMAQEIEGTSDKLKKKYRKRFFDFDYYTKIDDPIHFAPDAPKTTKMYSGVSELYRLGGH